MLLLKLNNMQNHYDLNCSKLFHGKSKQVPMKKIRPLRCLPLLLLAFATALPASASEPATPKVVTPRPELTAANEDAERLGQAVYQVLLAEVALRRGNPMLAATAYADLARRTRDARIARRAAELSVFARQADLVTGGPWSWGQVYSGHQQREIWNSMGKVLVGQSMSFDRVSKTTALAPISTFAVFKTAPMPVVTPQPI